MQVLRDTSEFGVKRVSAVRKLPMREKVAKDEPVDQEREQITWDHRTHGTYCLLSMCLCFLILIFFKFSVLMICPLV